MTLKFLNIKTINEKLTDIKSLIKEINSNFTEIRDRGGAQILKEYTVTIPNEKWHNGDTDTIMDVQTGKIDKTSPSTNIAGRVWIEVKVDAPENSHISYTDIILLPSIADTNENVTMCEQIASCGVELADHTSLNNLLAVEGDPNKRKLILMFRAVNAKPKIPIEYKLALI